VHHVRSSQAFAFNLFYPFAGPELHHLKRPLSTVIPHLAEIESLAFEYVPEVDVLGEWAGDEPGVPFTASDVGIIFRTDEGHRGIALIEVKFTESGFTHCFGRRSRANHRRDVCRSWDVFRQEPAGCYLTRPKRATKDRRYWSIIKNQFGSIEGFFVDGTSPYLGCPFAGDFQQPMRNHALALGLEQAKLFDVAFLILAYHDANDVILRKWKHYCQATVDQSRLGTLTASAVVDAVAGLDQGFWPDYIRYHAERYQIAAW